MIKLFSLAFTFYLADSNSKFAQNLLFINRLIGQAVI
jgi:hypothetical protein